ncbi:hypothetical protein F4225_04275 [Candidatus Poribacteria bacterium]|nr:hypothetical protein [Candidatus Poribacteria bacterium]
MISPKQLAETILILLEEAVLSVLFIEQSEYLKPADISKRLGIDKASYGIKGRDYPIIGSVLEKLEREERIERDREFYPKWGLTESEIKERSNTGNLLHTL